MSRGAKVLQCLPAHTEIRPVPCTSASVRELPDRLLTSKQAAEYLAKNEVTLRHWRAQGTGPAYVRLPVNSIRYRLSDLIAWVSGGSASA